MTLNKKPPQHAGGFLFLLKTNYLLMFPSGTFFTSVTFFKIFAAIFFLFTAICKNT